MTPIRILIADDHVAIREGIRQMLGRSAGIEVRATAATAEEVYAAVRAHEFDVIVLDLSLGSGPTNEVIARLHELAPDVPVLVYTMYPEDEYAARLFADGIAGYVTKDSPPDVLIEAIRRVRAGGRYVSRQLAEVLAANAGRRARTPHEQLSEREMQVLVMTAEGRSLKEIGTALGVSLKTVSTYRTRTLQKLGLTTNADLIRYAITNRLMRS